MDDLAGLDWNTSASAPSSKLPPMGSGNYYPSLRQTPPISGRSTPALQPSSTRLPRPPSKTATPANDSFANLLPFGTTNIAKNIPLQEQQKLLQQRQEHEEQQRRQQLDAHFGALSSGSLGQLGNGRATPERIVSPPKYTGTDEYGGQKLSATINKPFAAIGGSTKTPLSRKSTKNDEDLLAAFDADTPVNTASYLPAPMSQWNSTGNGDNRAALSATNPMPNGVAATSTNTKAVDDDDPFGLGTIMPSKAAESSSSTTYEEEEDILGLLGRPVSELPPRPLQTPESPKVSAVNHSGPTDRGVAELVDMGFPADKAKVALDATESGSDVQAAVGWLLNQAHEESRTRSKPQEARGRLPEDRLDNDTSRKPSRTSGTDATAPMPAWLRQQSRSNSAQRRDDSRSPVNGEKDPTKYASELGSKFLTTANSLWKTGTKKINQAVSELNSDSDSSQPKWMRDKRSERQLPQTRSSHDANGVDVPVRKHSQKSPSSKTSPPITDEAMMLESGDVRPRPRQRVQPSRTEPRPVYGNDSSRDQSPVAPIGRVSNPQPKFMQQQSVVQPLSKLSRQAVEEENAQSYVSPARRKKPTPKPPSPEPGLLFNTSSRSQKPAQPKQNISIQIPSKASIPLVVRPPPPVRKIPPLSSIALQSSTSHRQAGTSAFKLGNYAQATLSYTASLSSLPSSHPITIVLLTNRALTHLKTGDPKASIFDADSALALIGPSKGAGESIDIGGDEGSKPMDLYWGKAMTRRAEALEQLERWPEAAKAWKDCVEAGIGGSTSIQARNRCEIAASPAAAASPRRPPPTTRKQPPPRSTALSSTLAARPTASTAPSAEAVTRLRAANAAAERVDDEKFALADTVDERLGRWRKGKEGNLRALLGSLDTVLWEGAGWKKVGMSELVVPGKVKVAYMRGIAKVHPDKVS